MIFVSLNLWSLSHFRAYPPTPTHLPSPVTSSHQPSHVLSYQISFCTLACFLCLFTSSRLSDTGWGHCRAFKIQRELVSPLQITHFVGSFTSHGIDTRHFFFTSPCTIFSANYVHPIYHLLLFSIPLPSLPSLPSCSPPITV